MAHGQCQRAILKGHVAVFDRQVPHQIGEFQPAVPGDLKDWVIEPRRQLLDATGLAAACGAKDIERFVSPLGAAVAVSGSAAYGLRQLKQGDGNGRF